MTITYFLLVIGLNPFTQLMYNYYRRNIQKIIHIGDVDFFTCFWVIRTTVVWWKSNVAKFHQKILKFSGGTGVVEITIREVLIIFAKNRKSRIISEVKKMEKIGKHRWIH